MSLRERKNKGRTNVTVTVDISDDRSCFTENEMEL